ncbi:MAG: ABC transporter substrate-binding protein [Lachnospiraceae bacterium]|nr:ABC transporter substrate-binding protein [Lachnospiraceae bacterium]
MRFRFLSILTLSLVIAGCNNGSTDSSEKSLDNSNDSSVISMYTASPLTIPHEQVFTATVSGDYLYYVTGEDDNLLLVRVDLENPSSSYVFPLDIPLFDKEQDPDSNLVIPDSYVRIVVNDDIVDDGQVAHILVYSYANNGKISSTFWYQIAMESIAENNDENSYQNIGSEVRGVFDISDIFSSIDGTVSINGFTIDKGGNAYFAFGDELIVLNQDGSIAFQLNVGRGIQVLFNDYEGNVGVSYREGIADAVYTAIVDFAGQSLTGTRRFIAETTENYEIINKISIETSDVLFVADKHGVYDYSLINDISSERFTWSMVGIYPLSIHAFPLSDNRVLVTDSHRGNTLGKTTFFLVRHMTASEIAEAITRQENVRVITLGMLGEHMDHMFQQEISDFNRKNPDIRIELIQYGTTTHARDYGEQMAAYNIAMLSLNLDIIKGQAPDIMYFRNPIAWGRYARMGVFEDLHPFLDKDSLFDWADYQENEIRAFEVGGELLGFPIAYMITTMITREADVPLWSTFTSNQRDSNQHIALMIPDSLNLHGFIEFVDSFGADEEVFFLPTKQEVLNICLWANGDIIVDWDSDDTGFNREFLEIALEFANRYVCESEYQRSERELLDIRAQRGEVRVLASQATLATPSFFDEYAAIFGEAVSYVGYPAETGSGFVISVADYITLSSNSNDKEAAWAFISGLISAESRFAFMFRTEQMIAMANSMRGLDSKVNRSILSNSYDITISDAGISAYLDIRRGAVKVRDFDMQIDNIIKEEAGAYFSGGKSLDEVLVIIENRVGIYVKEMK